MMDLGTAIQKRRQAMDLSLSELTRLMGGAPGESYLSRVERGVIPLSPEVARKLARVLRYPEDKVLNAAGRTTDEQIEQAARDLLQIAVTPVPRTYILPVLNEAGDTIETRRRMMSADEQAFLFDIPDVPTTPDSLSGEALVLTERKPVDGIGVIADIDGTLSAWIYCDQGGKVWIENGRKERRGRGFTVRGIIARVARERTFID